MNLIEIITLWEKAEAVFQEMEYLENQLVSNLISKWRKDMLIPQKLMYINLY